MSEESSRDIERLLLKAAEKRRQEAGAPFDLHPATRRWLQDEVARTRGAGGREPASPSLWEKLAGWRFRLATAASLLIVAGITSLMIWPARHSSEPGRSASLGLADSSEVSSAVKHAEPPAPTPLANAPAPVLAPHPATIATVASKGSKLQPTSVLEAGDSGPKYAADSVAAAPTPTSAAVGEKQTLAKRQLVHKDASGAVDSRPQRWDSVDTTKAGQVSSDSRLRESLDVLAKDKTATSGDFARNDRRAAPDSAPAPRAGVVAEPLANFQFVQTGDRVQVLDSDGSAYTGSIQMASAPVPEDGKVQKSDLPAKRDSQQFNQSQKFMTTRSRAEASNATGGAAAIAGNAGSDQDAAANQAWTFSVAGSNRTLNQSVRFQGQLLRNSAGNSALNQAFAASGNATQLGGAVSNQIAVQGQRNQNVSNLPVAFPSSLPLGQSRISGEVQIGDRPPVPLEAQPVGP